jgi:hypothetical protein
MEHPAILILGLIIEDESKSLIFPNILSESYHSKSCNPPIDNRIIEEIIMRNN